MGDSIKSRIRQAVFAELCKLQTERKVRTVERHHDLIATTQIRPGLVMVDTGELEKDRDTMGQTYEFDLFVKIVVEPNKDSDRLKDELVALVQQRVEGLTGLDALGAVVCGGEEKVAI